MIGNLFYLFLCATLAGARAGSQAEALDRPSCLDDDGNTVDWYIVYKFPRISHKKALLSSGDNYAYITSESIKSKLRKKTRHNERSFWTISANKITDSKSMVLRTLDLAYRDGKPRLNSIFYSDQPPDDPLNPVERGPFFGGSNAHAKGALLMDDESGQSIWMTHSVPSFPPPISQPLKFEDNFQRNGQTFMCINYNLDEAGKQVMEHLAFMNPLVYHSKVTKRLRARLPEMAGISIDGAARVKGDPKVKKLSQTIKTRAGEFLHIFSKSTRFKDDIYSEWMDDELGSDLYVQSWRRGGGSPLNSTCPESSHNINNVKDMSILNNGRYLSWSFTQDHSKWAISGDPQKGLVCIGDINRMQSQFRRGGGAICIKCPSCWTAFSQIILDLEGCPIQSHT